MLDDDTIETLLDPGTLPGTEDTHEIPVLITPQFQPVPPHLAHDPILTMCLPHPTTPSLFDHVYGPDAPRMLPGRPLKSPRVRITARDHVLAAMAAAALLLAVGSYVMVESGWRADMPQAQDSGIPAVQVSTPARIPAPQSSALDLIPPPPHHPGHTPSSAPALLSAPTRTPDTPSVHIPPPSVHVPPPGSSSSPSVPSSPSPSPSASPPTPSPVVPTVSVVPVAQSPSASPS